MFLFCFNFFLLKYLVCGTATHVRYLPSFGLTFYSLVITLRPPGLTFKNSKWS
jgi:hypothetical protein